MACLAACVAAPNRVEAVSGCRQQGQRATGRRGPQSHPGRVQLGASSSSSRGSRGTALRVHAGAAAPLNGPSGEGGAGNGGSSSSEGWLVGGLAAAALAGGGYWACNSGAAAPLVAAARHGLSSSLLAKSGFFAAFSLIFLSELGDKTFFIAALLAMRCGKWVSFVGSVAALSVMTVISVAIGAAVKRVPAAVESSEAVGQWLGAALLLYFGLRTLKTAWDTPAQGGDGEEFEEAEESVKSAEEGGKIGAQRAPWQALFEVASLIFVAEWGDRSMLATIALGAAQSPVGVAGGAVAGHALATLIAVIGGAVLSKHISEKTVGYIGGTLFIVFAAATVLGVF